MSELKIKFTYNGEDSFFDFLKYIEGDDEFKFDKHLWNGEIKIGRYIFVEKEKDFGFICFKIFFHLKERKNVPIEINLHN